jgi:hypothetical protein
MVAIPNGGYGKIDNKRAWLEVNSRKKPNPEIIRYLFRVVLLFPTFDIDQNAIPNIRPPRGLLNIVIRVVKKARKN